METKLVRIAEISATSKHPIFTSVYHLINEDMLKQCHKELDGNKAVGIDKVTKDEYGKNLDRNIKELVQRLKNKSFKPLPSLRVYIPKGNGKKRPLGIASYEDKIVQMAVKKILGAIYEPRFLNCMYGFRPNRGCHEAIKEVYQRISYGKISYIVDADIKGFFDHIDHDWMMKFLEWNIQDRNLLWLIRKYLKAGIMEQGGDYMTQRKIALSIEEAADYTGIGRNTLRQLVEWKKLPVLKVGRKVLIKTDILEMFMEANEGRDLRDRGNVKAVTRTVAN